MRKPAALREGDVVGIVAPASPPAEAGLIFSGAQRLKDMGLRVRFGRHVTARRGYLAGGDAERAADLLEMFADPEVRAVFCVRGGYGSSRLYRHLDFDLIRRNPKIIVGCSDITSLLLAINAAAGLIVFHGPMVAGELAAGTSAPSLAWLRRALFEAAPLGPVIMPSDMPPPVTIRTGCAAGTLIGGNLSLVVASLGTPFEPDTDGRILFLEEVGEAPYRIDRMLVHLRNAGVLANVAGVVIGECVRCAAGMNRDHAGPPEAGQERLLEVLDDVLGDLGVPVLYGLPVGHGRHNLALPVGVEATLDASAGRLEITEAATVP